MAVYDEPLVMANIVVSDEMLDQLIAHSLNTRVTIYCTDKAATMAALQELGCQKPLEALSEELAASAALNPELTEAEFLYRYMEVLPENATSEYWVWYYINSGLLEITVSDPYGETYRAYQEAASLRLDGRTIVIFTLIAVSLVMLYLLCRSQVQGRLALLAVYRLLGIPGRKLYRIFTLEGILSAMRTILPSAVLTWGAVQVLKQIPEIELTLLLPWQAAGIVALLILGYYLLVSLLPLSRLLKLPPAQLAAKYDI